MEEINQNEVSENEVVILVPDSGEQTEPVLSDVPTRADADAYLESAEPAVWLFGASEDSDTAQAECMSGLSAELMDKFSTILMTEF